MVPADPELVEQRRLDALLSQRHQLAARGLTPSGPAPGAGDVVAVVVRRFDLTSMVRGAMAFAAGLSAEAADGWFRAYTRTLFLFGNPHNLAARHAPALGTAGAETAWFGPWDARRMEALSRLLKPLRGDLPALPQRCDIPGSPAAPAELHVAVGGLNLPQYLIHLHHTLAEAVLLGTLAPDAPVRLIHWPDVDPVLAASGDADYVRVHYAAGDESRLRLYTLLTPPRGTP